MVALDNSIALVSLRTSLAIALDRNFAARSKITPEEWCEEVYRLPGGRRFRWDYAPYARGMFRSLFDRRTRETSFKVFSRGLKSTVILMASGFLIDRAPRKLLFMWPTVGQAEKFSKDALDGELFSTTPCLNYLSSQSGKRKSSQTILHKAFPGGSLTAFGANAAGELRRAKGSFLAADEIDAYEIVLTDEGDILAIFWRRGSEFPDTIRVSASYPSVIGKSRIDAKYQASDRGGWFSTCVRCGGEPFIMTRSLLFYEEGKPETARMACPRCREYLTDAERYSMAHRQGFDNWKSAREFTGLRGFHGSGMLWPHPSDPEKYPGGFLQELAQMEIDADGSENPARSRKVLVNTVDAEPFDPLAEDEKPPEWKPLFDRREPYAGVPAGGLVITGAADLQLNRIEVEWKAWGRGEESWGLEHVVIDGDVRDVGVWELFLRELRSRRFFHASGVEMEFSLFFVDGGFWSEWLFQFLAKLARELVPGVSGKVRATKGVGASPHPVVTDWRSIAKNLKGYHVGTWQVKEVINRRLLMEPNADGTLPEGWMHWNEGYSEEYFRQLCTAKATVDFKNGEEIRTYPGEHGVRDEALDLNVYNYAAFRKRRWDFDAIEADLKERAAALKSGKPAEKPKPPKSRMRHTSGFI